MKHLTVGGSTAARTLACPGWIEKSKGITPRPAGQAAIDGSMHHEVMELCQKTGTEPNDHAGLVYTENGFARIFIEEDFDLAYSAFNATNALLEEMDIDELEIEPFVQYEVDEVGGSTDLLGLSADRKTILSLDYKFGRSPVKAKNNAQLLFYPMCARRDSKTEDMFKDAETLELVIIQPQSRTVVDRWSCPIKELDAFEKKFVAALRKIQSGKALTVAGPHCNYCPSAPYCDTKLKQTRQASLIDPKNHADLAKAASLLEQVEQWVKDVKEELYLQLSNGVDVEGWKIIEKRASRKWLDADAALAALLAAGIEKGDLTDTKMLTAPQVEAMLKKKKVEFDLDAHITKISSGTTLAPASHKSDAVVVTEVVGHLAEIMK